MRAASTLVLASLLLAAACGDDTSVPASGDASVQGGDAAAADGGTMGDARASDAGAPVDDAGPAVPLPAVPFHTDSRWILDAKGKRFKLASVNWYGAEEKDHVVAGLDRAELHAVARLIRAEGFNSVRLPWSNEMYELDPLVDDARVAANPKLRGLHAMEIFDRVIAALAHEGLVVVLDNHTSRADWCCSGSDGNGLWYTSDYPEASWLADWRGIVQRYESEPAVIGADLRNELRAMDDGRTPTWGGSDTTLDWRAAAMRGGNAVLGVNPKLLVFVEGLAYATDLTGAYSNPISFAVPGRLVYEAHDYAWFHTGMTSYSDLSTALGNAWGFLLTQNKAFTAPVWVGEFGTQHDATNVDAASGAGLWFKSFRQYLANADIDWSYWALNGTAARGATRTTDTVETFGVLDATWSAPASKDLDDALHPLEAATQGPP